MSNSEPTPAPDPDAAAGAGDGVSRSTRLASADRAKAFTDAVVAIAMTLLILPLLDTIGGAASKGESTGDWLAANVGSIVLFALSFAVIASFWVRHHRLFAQVRLVSERLLWILIAWMLTIVWLPVATALTGQLASDNLQRTVYIGSMALTSAMLFAARMDLRRHPNLHTISPTAMTRGLTGDVLSTVMFLVCLVVAVVVPGVGYSAMFLMLLLRPLNAIAARIQDRPRH